MASNLSQLCFLGLLAAALSLSVVPPQTTELIAQFSAPASGLTREVICGGSEKVLTCPEDQVFSITDAEFGTKRGVCGLTSNGCSSPVTTKVQALCNNNITCGVQVSNSVFNTKCTATKNAFLRVDYKCTAPTLPNLTCEGESATVSCPNGQKINSVSVFYGRQFKFPCSTNGGNQNIACSSTTAAAAASQLCVGKRSCSLQATNNALGGDPCEGTSKYLTASRTCKDVTKTLTTLCNGSTQTIKCPPGTLVRVVSAVYARGDLKNCSPTSTTRICRGDGTKSLAEVSALCEGKSSCTLTADNSVFTDPCPTNTAPKFLRLVYACQD